jgi:hypothetical protein
MLKGILFLDKLVGQTSDLPKNAVGEMIPVLLATTIAIPVSRKGNEKSIACDLSKLILSDVITISAWWLTRAATNPFQRPFCGHNIIEVPVVLGISS